MYQIGFFLLAVLAGVLPFAAPGPCTQALREGLVLCGGPLLLSLFPFLVVSSLLVQCPASDLLAVPFRPLARGIGVHSPCAARVLMIGFFGGFAPAANAAAQAVRTGRLTGREADALLPACVCSGPSFVVLTVGESMLSSAELGVLLFGAQLAASYLTAALLCRMAPAGEGMRTISVQPSPEPPHLTDVLTGAAIGYVKLCGFVLFFRMLATGAGALLPPMAGTLCAMLLEVCSGCDLRPAPAVGQPPLLRGSQCAGAFGPAPSPGPLPAGNDAPAPIHSAPFAPAAFTGAVLSAAAERGAERIQHPAAAGGADAPSAAGLSAAGVLRLLPVRVRAEPPFSKADPGTKRNGCESARKMI